MPSENYCRMHGSRKKRAENWMESDKVGFRLLNLHIITLHYFNDLEASQKLSKGQCTNN